MAVNLRHRSFVSEFDFTTEELRYLIALSAELKAASQGGTEQACLAGKRIALVFEKEPPARTLCAFEVAAYDQGAHVTFMGPKGSQAGRRESMKDTARVLGRVFDAIEYRGFGREFVEELAEYARVPVYNGLSEEFHATRTLTDMVTMQEHSDKPLSEVAYCYVGDARSDVGDSLMIMGAQLGMDVRICAPYSMWPDAGLAEAAHILAKENGGRLLLTDDVDQGVRGVDFLYADLWAALGEDPSVWQERIKLLRPYRVNMDMIERTGNPLARFMHCIPAFHDRRAKAEAEIYDEFSLEALEVTDDFFETWHSIVFDEAENSMHTIKAVLVATLAG